MAFDIHYSNNIVHGEFIKAVLDGKRLAYRKRKVSADDEQDAWRVYQSPIEAVADMVGPLRGSWEFKIMDTKVSWIAIFADGSLSKPVLNQEQVCAFNSADTPVLRVHRVELEVGTGEVISSTLYQVSDNDKLTRISK